MPHIDNSSLKTAMTSLRN